MINFTTANNTPAGPIGQGTWYLGENKNTYARELTSLRTGIELGMNLIDTAEMYGDGKAEKLVGDAIRGYDRDSLFLVSKVYPWNAGRKHIYTSCENSLRRMKTEHLDLYLLHWTGSIPFRETIECMEDLKAKGRIRNWGVSNLSVEEMQQLLSLPNGSHCLTNQVLYHLGSRGIEFDMLPYLRRKGVSVMAYCPLAQAGTLRRGLMTNPVVAGLANKYAATPSQILLAWLLAQDSVIPIPRTSRAEHTIENQMASSITFSAEDLSLLDKAFPAPNHKTPLDMQ